MHHGGSEALHLIYRQWNCSHNEYVNASEIWKEWFPTICGNQQPWTVISIPFRQLVRNGGSEQLHYHKTGKNWKNTDWKTRRPWMICWICARYSQRIGMETISLWYLMFKRAFHLPVPDTGYLSFTVPEGFDFYWPGRQCKELDGNHEFKQCAEFFRKALWRRIYSWRCALFRLVKLEHHAYRWFHLGWSVPALGYGRGMEGKEFRVSTWIPFIWTRTLNSSGPIPSEWYRSFTTRTPGRGS